MTVTITATALLSGTSSTETIGVPVIEGTGADSYTNSSVAGRAFNASTSFTGRKGCRITLLATTDISARQYIGFGLYTTTFNPQANMATVANGGLRVVFVDTLGNYAGFNIYGSGIPGYNGTTSGGAEGFFIDFAGFANGSGSLLWYIDKSRTPDIASGTAINWAQVAHVELTASHITSGSSRIGINRMIGTDPVAITGTENLESIVTSVRGSTDATRLYNSVRRSGYIDQSASGRLYNSHLGFNVGNGSTVTNWTDSGFQLGFVSTYDKSPTYRSVGPLVLLDNSNTRKIYVNQSASDVLSLSDGSIASAAWWQWELIGSGSATLNRMQFWRFNAFKAGHGIYTDCAWDGGEAAIEVAATTAVVRGVVRNGAGHGIKLSGAAGNYSGLDITFGNNSTYDIELGSGGAGTYNLSGVSVAGGYTLKIRNDSATNAITVQIAAGITYSTSTAGGTITISAPQVYQKVTISNLTTGSRVQIYDTTSSTELANEVSAGATVTWTDSVAAVSSRAIRVRISYVSGTSAKAFIEASIGTCGITEGTESVSYLANQTNDTTYNTNAINGSTVTGITFTDAATDLVNINLAGGSSTWPNIYAAFVYWISTAAGIADDIAYISAPDTANYLLTSMKVKNTSSPSVPLTITGGFGRDATSGTIVDIVDTSGGNVYPLVDHVVAFATGSALTAGQDSTLSAIKSATDAYLDATVSSRATNAGVLSAATATPIAANIKQVNSLAVDGAGTEADPWGPV